MLKHKHGGDDQLIICELMGIEMPETDGVGNDALSCRGHCNMCTDQLGIIVRGQSTDATHKTRNHGFAEIGERFFLIDPNPRAFSASPDFHYGLLFARGISVRPISADLERCDAFCAQRTDNDVCCPKIKTLFDHLTCCRHEPKWC